MNPNPLIRGMLALLLSPAPTWALAEQAPNCAQISAIDKYPGSESALVGATCSAFLSQARATGVSCFWAFPYRNQLALQNADQIWEDLVQCRDGASLEPDTPVNHPDSYYLREWATDKAVYRVSVKDKAGQSRTLVFLSMVEN